MSHVIAGVEVPDTAAVAEASRLIRETTGPLLYHRSRRVFLFGRIHAQRLGLEPDPELLYLAAMFHDAGLVNGTVNSSVLEHFIPGFRRTTTVERIVGSAWPS